MDCATPSLPPTERRPAPAGSRAMADRRDVACERASAYTGGVRATVVPIVAVLAPFVVAALSCAPRAEPPGRSIERAGPTESALAMEMGAPVDAGAQASRDRDAEEPGHGAKIASIAMHTWIYIGPNDRSAKLGYLRAGAVVDRAEASAGVEGCAGGWYRILPRGFVCVGKGASLALDHQVVQAAVRGPQRGAPLPYTYVSSKSPPPHMYFRLPTAADQRRVEGATLGIHLAQWARPPGLALDPVPQFLAEGRDLPKPYGAEEKLRYSVHSGRAKEASAFGLVTTFEWTGRLFGLTTELDLLPLDRTKLARPSSMHGVETKGEGTPALVGQGAAMRLEADGKGGFHDKGRLEFRTGVVLTGKASGGARGLVELTDGSWVAASSLLVPEPREDPSGYARSGRKWIDISIRKQLLVAYEGTKPVYATLVSTGRGGMEDPEVTLATARGVFTIHSKHVSSTMDGDEESLESFDLRDVPYVQYFYKGYALHGAFWHDDFGKVHSHGCVNLAPADAAWLFEWTEPFVPPEWHGAVNPEGGTLVYIHG